MKRILAIIMSAMIAVSMLSTLAFAADEDTNSNSETRVETESVSNDDEYVKIENGDINISKNEKNEFKKLTQDVAKAILKDDSKKVSKTIKSATSNSKNSDALDTINDEIVSVVKSDCSNPEPNIILSEKFCDDFEYTYKSDDTEIVMNPLYIEVTEFDESLQKEKERKMFSAVTDLIGSEVYAASKTKSRICSEKKTYYSWAGLKIFTIGMDCNFYYNGKKAWYKSGFDAWYTRGALSVWQVSNWKKKKEQNGKSYTAWCAGNFHMGLEVKGVGVVLDDKYIKHKITCNKKGKISISRTGFKLNK